MKYKYCLKCLVVAALICIPINLLLERMTQVQLNSAWKFYVELERPCQASEEGVNSSFLNETIISNISQPDPDKGTRRILWWSTVYGDEPQFFGIDPELTADIGKKCAYKCEFTLNKTLLNRSHAVMFHGWAEDLPVQTVEQGNISKMIPAEEPKVRDPRQLYIYMTFEAFARVRENMEAYADFFNWTVSYSSRSDLMLAYGRLVRKPEHEFLSYSSYGQRDALRTTQTKLVAWMAYNCNETTSSRNDLIKELQKYIPVSVYGRCGGRNLTCKSSGLDCYKEIGTTHKFYLALENSLCEDYVTEKFFNALHSNMVPIVYGGANYGLIAPPGSFINVNSFPSAKALARYLEQLNEDEEEYLKYFEWKRMYTVDLYWYLDELYCSVCKRVHKEYGVKESRVNIHEFLHRDRFNKSVCTEPQQFL